MRKSKLKSADFLRVMNYLDQRHEESMLPGGDFRDFVLKTLECREAGTPLEPWERAALGELEEEEGEE
jgi:hypothetical protein